MISEEECVKAIKSMQNGKSPGTDGLPVEFYKIFWKKIALTHSSSDIIPSQDSFSFSFNFGISVSS
jgi:hypothetical protein